MPEFYESQYFCFEKKSTYCWTETEKTKNFLYSNDSTFSPGEIKKLKYKNQQV